MILCALLDCVSVSDLGGSEKYGVPCPFGTLTNLQLLAIGDPIVGFDIGAILRENIVVGDQVFGGSGRDTSSGTENGYSTDADGNRGGKLPLSKNHK